MSISFESWNSIITANMEHSAGVTSHVYVMQHAQSYCNTLSYVCHVSPTGYSYLKMLTILLVLLMKRCLHSKSGSSQVAKTMAGLARERARGVVASRLESYVVQGQSSGMEI